MSATSDVDQLLREARKSGLTVEAHGTKWRISNQAGGQAFVPSKGAGRSLANIRAEIRRLAVPAPMVAAVTPNTLEEDAVSWPIEQLLTLAEQQGVRVDVRGGLLHVSGPVEAESFARLLRDREADVLAHLNPQEETVPSIRDVARIDIPAPIYDVAADSRNVWEVVRGLAKAHGDEHGLNAGVPGVLWRGALNRVMRETHPSWPDDYRKDVSALLERTGHMKCQSRHANPPVWWIKSEWDDGGLVVTKTAAKARPRQTVDVADTEALWELISDDEFVAALAARLKRDPGTEQRIADLETANHALQSRVADLEREVEAKDERLSRFEAAAAIFRGAS